MLHRGQYSVEAKSDKQAGVLPLRERLRPSNLLHFDSNFTFKDKLVAGGIFWWSMLLVMVNVVVSLWNGFSSWPLEWWAHYWMVTGIAVPLLIAFGTLIWFGIGGVIDMKAFFLALRTRTRDARDDGRVVGHQNLADLPSLPTVDDAAVAPAAAPAVIPVPKPS
jgi:SSS family solute:Na+ symporter